MGTRTNRYRKGEKSTGVRVGILNGKPALIANWGGRIYGAPLSLDGAGNTTRESSFGSIRVAGNAIFDSGASVLIIEGGGISIKESGVEVAKFGATTTVADINLTGKIAITSTGTQNVCIGTGNTDLGEDNIAIGVDAGASYDGATKQNIAIGTKALEDTNDSGGLGTDGSFNIGLGYKAGYNITEGAGNIAVGLGALASNTVNTGSAVGNDLTTGDGNICIGNFSGVSSANSSFRTVIGREAQGTGDYSIAIGYQASAAIHETVIGYKSVFRFASKQYVCDIADAEDTKSASTDSSPIKLPALSVIKSISVVIEQLSNLSVFNVALYISSDAGAVADDTALGSAVEVLGAGVAATLSGASSSAEDIALGTTGTSVNKAYHMDEAINVGGSDRYLHIGQAGTGNGDTDPGTNGLLNVLVEYVALD